MSSRDIATDVKGIASIARAQSIAENRNLCALVPETTLEDMESSFQGVEYNFQMPSSGITIITEEKKTAPTTQRLDQSTMPQSQGSDIKLESISFHLSGINPNVQKENQAPPIVTPAPTQVTARMEYAYLAPHLAKLHAKITVQMEQILHQHATHPRMQKIRDRAEEIIRNIEGVKNDQTRFNLALKESSYDNALLKAAAELETERQRVLGKFYFSDCFASLFSCSSTAANPIQPGEEKRLEAKLETNKEPENEHKPAARSVL